MRFLQDLTYEEVEKTVLDCGMPKYRAGQLFSWITRGAKYGEMSNIPQSLKDFLVSQGHNDEPVRIIRTLESKLDGTVKFLYALQDNNVIEGVLMKYKYGNTLCVSTQVGCRMNCAFCASGLDGLVRNLTSGEILGQIIAVNGTYGAGTVGNVVLMGSGEPLDNYDNTVKFLTNVSDPRGLNISKRGVSLSTCGLCDKMRLLCDQGYTPTLTVSLHAPNDEIRKKIMPIAVRYSVSEVVDAAKYYFNVTGRRVIFEYSLIKGVNDSMDCAKELARLIKGFPCHVNLIALNSVKERGLAGTLKEQVEQFRACLEKLNVSVTLRRSMGADIDGACGQLRRKFIKAGGGE
mgnify:FL=1